MKDSDRQTHRSSDQLAALIERIGRLVTSGGFTEGLNPAQWAALDYLSRANRFSRNPKSVAAYLEATKGTVSQTVMALERKGLVEKRQSEGDRRGVALEVTDAGRSRVASRRQRQLALVLDDLGPEARQGLEAGLAALLEGLIVARDGLPFGQCAGCRYFRRHMAGEGTSEGAPHFCGLLREPLSETDATLICAEFAPPVQP
ncbi:MarR family winged helix-turn-helix transcriptional regulator [Cucumibacter marinus]|uniref:MarR family winged helix-turn-helix transcriptional regulator n=1 Tax=Cucumibacter marinus TaxID=1121252 RepID=UPI0004155A2F|nr:MarR family transcriptional regulator [Cucumibacter marinus]